MLRRIREIIPLEEKLLQALYGHEDVQKAGVRLQPASRPGSTEELSEFRISVMTRERDSDKHRRIIAESIEDAGWRPTCCKQDPIRHPPTGDYLLNESVVFGVAKPRRRAD